MKKPKKAGVIAGAAYICALYALISYITYNYGNGFPKLQVLDFVCAGGIIASTLIIYLSGRPLASLLISTGICIGISIFCYSYSFLFYPAALIMCLSQSLFETHKTDKLCYALCCALMGLTVPVWIYGMASSTYTLWAFVGIEGAFYKAFTAVFIVIFIILLKLSFGLKTNGKKSKQKGASAAVSYNGNPDKASNIYLFAIISLTGNLIYCLMYTEMGLSKAVTVAWLVALTALLLSDDPAACMLRQKFSKTKTAHK